MMKVQANSPEELENYIQNNFVELIDAAFVDPIGRWHHCYYHPSQVKAKDIIKGLPFDGSSVRLFTSISSSDMLMKPDPSTCWIDPFRKHKVLHVTGNVYTSNGEPFKNCPRSIASKAVQLMKDLDIADKAFFGPEAEFFIFENVQYSCTPNKMSFSVDSGEASWNSSATSQESVNGKVFHNLGTRDGISQNYLQTSPIDKFVDIRTEMLLTLQDIGIEVEKHHHEVAAMQQEMGYVCKPMVESADIMMCYKYIVKNTAHKHGLSATFMPKPIFGTSGSGMHCHQSLWKNGKNLFHDDNGSYMKLSQTALWYIGGIIAHAPAILAFTNPTTNSYKRLVKGFEAPVALVYSKGNRSAAIRIPAYDVDIPSAKRFEFRCPDPACCPYIAFSVMLMAGLDGIINKIDPPPPQDKDIYHLTPEEAMNIKKTPHSLQSALDALKNDFQFLTRNQVFTAEFIQGYIELKEKEVTEFDMIPHPKEFELYYNC